MASGPGCLADFTKNFTFTSVPPTFRMNRRKFLARYFPQRVAAALHHASHFVRCTAVRRSGMLRGVGGGGPRRGACAPGCKRNRAPQGLWYAPHRGQPRGFHLGRSMGPGRSLPVGRSPPLGSAARDYAPCEEHDGNGIEGGGGGRFEAFGKAPVAARRQKRGRCRPRPRERGMRCADPAIP